MRFFLTRDTPLAAALVAAGHTISSTPAMWADAYLNWTETDNQPQDYPLRRLTKGLESSWDVLIVVDPLFGAWGHPRGAVERWRRQRTKTVVALVRNDPNTLHRYVKHQFRGCVCRLEDFGVYLSNHQGSVTEASYAHRSALWAPGLPIGPVLAMIEHARSGKNYTPPRRPRKGKR